MSSPSPPSISIPHLIERHIVCSPLQLASVCIPYLIERPIARPHAPVGKAPLCVRVGASKRVYQPLVSKECREALPFLYGGARLLHQMLGSYVPDVSILVVESAFMRLASENIMVRVACLCVKEKCVGVSSYRTLDQMLGPHVPDVSVLVVESYSEYMCGYVHER